MYLMFCKWQVWKVTDGMTTTLCTHLEDKHAELYPELCDRLHLNHAHCSLPTLSPSVPDDFTQEGFREWLMHFIAADDQVQCPLTGPLLPLTPIDDSSQLMLLSVKSFENCSCMLGLVILKTGIYHIGQRQLNLSLRSMKSVTESRKSE